eukprot:5341098-Pleurochrysis_carterae.AAC.3
MARATRRHASGHMTRAHLIDGAGEQWTGRGKPIVGLLARDDHSVDFPTLQPGDGNPSGNTRPLSSFDPEAASQYYTLMHSKVRLG